MTISKSMALGDLFAAAGLALPTDVCGAIQISAIHDNSRSVTEGSLFVATCGTQVDSHRFIGDAAVRGASCIVAQKPQPDCAVPVVLVEDSRSALGRLAHAWRGNPTRTMVLVGITGTNGKTTSSYLVESVLRAAGYNPGVIGTIEYRYANHCIAAENTTPGAVALAQLFSDMAAAGVNAVAMEVSSHAIDQHRIAGLLFDVALFTNLTQDHLDYHGTMANYANTKKRLFTDVLRVAQTSGKRPHRVVNIDDEVGRAWAAEFGAECFTYSCRADSGAVVYPATWVHDAGGMTFDVPAIGVQICSNLVAEFNLANILGAVGVGVSLGVSAEKIARGIEMLGQVPGRFESVQCGQPFSVFVDYSHTPDALERALDNVRKLTPNGCVFCVCGCGGDRDQTKRPIMGAIAAQLADVVIVTNDNPRTEDPERIADMIMDGVREMRVELHNVERILDRRAAIEFAVTYAVAGDAILIAGKGHENYQIVGTTVHAFDDKQVAAEFLQQKWGSGR